MIKILTFKNKKYIIIFSLFVFFLFSVLKLFKMGWENGTYYSKIEYVEKKVFHMPKDVNIVEFLGSVCYKNAKDLKDVYVDGGRFISCISGGNIVAGYFHPTRKHSITACPGHNLMTVYYSEKSEAPAGTWAVIITKASMYSCKTFYNIE